MARKISDQVKELIEKSKKILITTKGKFSGDGLASCLALAQVLKKVNKNSEIIIENFNLPQQYSFLPNISQIKPEAIKLKKFIINLDISQTGIDELSYDINGDNLRIYLSPQRGVFTSQDLKFQTSLFAYDLIFTLDTPDLEAIGKLYDNHRDLFYQIPVVNVDNSPDNEQYGHINIVDITATATTEILYNLINKWSEELIDEQLATCLLAGMIKATNCFKTANVTPNALQIVSHLIDSGANRREIINNLYQTKTINTLKLWGRILSRLQSNEQNKLIWSKLTPNDFIETGAKEEDAVGVINELIAHSPSAEIFVLFYQLEEGQTKVIAHSLGNYSILALTRSFSSTGDKNEVSFTLNKNLQDSEKEVIETIIQEL
ncbi:DHH family phosphoesterase [Patescibacteria group bacterium]|nr:DHH family phosphoesterase [Patescibacteria group bacterium]